MGYLSVNSDLLQQKSEIQVSFTEWGTVTQLVPLKPIDGTENGKANGMEQSSEPASEPPSEHSDETMHITKSWISKNLYILTFVFLLQFIAYDGLASLQSSLHQDDGLGTISQSVLHLTTLCSFMLLPRLFIMTFGHKKTIVMCIVGHILWMIANGYAVWWTMLPTSALVGVCTGLQWTCQGSYINQLALLHARLSNTHKDHVVSKYFSTFWALFNVSKIVSAVVSSAILWPHSGNMTSPAEDDVSMCGANDCHMTNVTNVNLMWPGDEIVWAVCGAYILVALCALFLAVFFLSELPRFDGGPRVESGSSSPSVLSPPACIATLKMNLKKEQLLLVPFLLYNGLYVGFFMADWSKSYVTCAIGISWLGILSLPAGILASITSYLGGKLRGHVHRVYIILFVLVCNVGILVLLLFWNPHRDQLYVFFIVSCLQGILGGLIRPQFDGFISSAFPKNTDAAFANVKMWSAAAVMIANGYSTLLCNTVKLYIVLSAWLLGVLGYLMVEHLVHRKHNRTQTHVVEEGERSEAEPL